MIVTAVLTITLLGTMPDVVTIHSPGASAQISAISLPSGCLFSETLNMVQCWATGEQMVIRAVYSCARRRPAVVVAWSRTWAQARELWCDYRLWLPLTNHQKEISK
jgi:hypothetical protein